MRWLCSSRRANFPSPATDGHGGDAEKLAEEVHGGESAQVENGDQDPARWCDSGLGACARGYQALMTATAESAPGSTSSHAGELGSESTGCSNQAPNPRAHRP